MSDDPSQTEHKWGGSYPADQYSPWPPKRPVGYGLASLAKRAHAALTKGHLVWLRDFDECQTLTVAHTQSDGTLVATRMWPFFRKVTLDEDGNAHCVGVEDGYTRHWIKANQTDLVFMMLQNSETYAEKPK